MSTDVSRPQQAQPASDRVWSIETNGINPIPESERHGKPFDMFWIWCAANIGILGVTYGAFLLGFSLSFWQAFLAGVLGTILSFILVGFISLAGKLGSAPTLVLSRASFGVRGNALPTLFSYVSLVGWETYLVAIATLGTVGVLERLGWFHGTFATAVSLVVIAALSVAIGLLGHATIVRVQMWFTWAFAVLTVFFILFELSKIHLGKLSSLPSGNLAQFIGGMSIIMAGLGIGWVNAAADYSRYLPRTASSRGVVWWTAFGASIAPIVLITFGVLLAANKPDLGSAVNPADLAGDLPTWFLVPYLIVAAGGLIAGVLLDVYSGGLNLLSLGVPLPRYQSVLIDAAIMIAGNIYLLFVAKSDFIFSFLGFLLVLGVAMASWAAVFLADMWMYRRRDGYAESDLYSVTGRYGAYNWAGIISFVVAVFFGLGLVTSGSPVFKGWVGYLLGPFGGKSGTVAYSSIGLLIAFVLAAVLYAVLSSLLANEASRGRAERTVVVP
jgi:NCS1 family nucleobase:cation symporter-1